MNKLNTFSTLSTVSCNGIFLPLEVSVGSLTGFRFPAVSAARQAHKNIIPGPLGLHTSWHHSSVFVGVLWNLNLPTQCFIPDTARGPDGM